MMGVQGAVAEEVNNRMRKAAGEIGEKYAAGQGGNDDSSDVTGPTGSTYKEKDLAENKAKKQLRDKKSQENSSESQQNVVGGNDNDDDGDDDADEDNELRRIRSQRLKQIRDSQREKLENIGKGHGQYREITQDEFLNEMVS